MGYVQRKLDEVMSENGISQAELSRASGISRPTVNRLCNGKTEIKPEWAVRVGYALDVDPNILYGQEAEERVKEARANVEIGSIRRIVD